MLAEHDCQQAFTSLYLAFIWRGWQGSAMRLLRQSGRVGTWAVLLGAAMLLRQSSADALAWPAIARSMAIEAVRFAPRGLSVKPPLHFVAAWRLRSDDRAFGGLSGLARVRTGFLALSDAGVLTRFDLDGTGETVQLLQACGGGQDRRTRDAESLALATSGSLYVGYERRDAICRLSPGGGAKLFAPAQMRPWTNNSGIESLVALRNDALLAIAERSPEGVEPSPVLVFGKRSNPVPLQYRPPSGFRPTDAAQLPGGALLVLNRAFRPPFSLPGRLVLVDRFDGKVMAGQVLARLDGPDLDQNFEGVAVSQARGRSFVWLVSDDNFMPMQDTMLLLFEYRPR